MANNRVGDIAVLNEGQSRLVARKELGAEVIEEGLEGIEYMKHGNVSGTPGDEVVKAHVFSSQALPLLNEAVLLRERTAQLGSIFVCTVLSGERGDLGLEEKAKLDEVIGQVRLAREQALKRFRERLTVRGAYKGPISLPDLKVAEELELTYRVTQASPRDAKPK
jgi:hypothetical protein